MSCASQDDRVVGAKKSRHPIQSGDDDSRSASSSLLGNEILGDAGESSWDGFGPNLVKDSQKSIQRTATPDQRSQERGTNRPGRKECAEVSDFRERTSESIRFVQELTRSQSMNTSEVCCLLALIISGDRQNTPEAKTEPLRGMVYAADGSPAAGAVVWTANLTHNLLDRRETVADAKGRFSVDLTPGSWFLWARRGTQGGEGPGQHQAIEITPGRAPESVTVRLEERGTF